LHDLLSRGRNAKYPNGEHAALQIEMVINLGILQHCYVVSKVARFDASFGMNYRSRGWWLGEMLRRSISSWTCCQILWSGVVSKNVRAAIKHTESRNDLRSSILLQFIKEAKASSDIKLA
jgi:hypothetical protein